MTVQEKREALMKIWEEDKYSFYREFRSHLKEDLPIVYDPGIAEAIMDAHHSSLPEGFCYLDIDHPEQMKNRLEEASRGRDIRLIVVTDSEAILGIGDWGRNGGMIALGKSMVYAVATHLDPKYILPVMLDVGTNNRSLLEAKEYRGLKKPRESNTDRYFSFIDQFVHTAFSLFSNLYLHFEDFGKLDAPKILRNYQDTYPVFNDDMEGTGIISLAAIYYALQCKNENLSDQTYLCFGAGTAGTGIMDRVEKAMEREGLSEKEARKHFYSIDRQGLLLDDDPTLTEEQKHYARSRQEFPQGISSLMEAIRQIHPSILVGTSTVHGAFHAEVIQELCKSTERPIVLALSNPTSKIEGNPKEILEASNGKAMLATGVPYEPVAFQGKTYPIGQANNFLAYPGLGLGAILSHAKRMTDGMIEKAAKEISRYPRSGEALLPDQKDLESLTEKIASAVSEEAIREGIGKPINEKEQKMLCSLFAEE